MANGSEATDFHESMIVVDETCPLLGARPESYKLWRRGGVTVAVPTIAVNQSCRDTIERLGAWLTFIDRNPDDLILIREVSDIHRAHRERLLGILFHFQNSVPIERDLNLLRVYHDLGVRMIQLAYNQKNFVGDGCEERTDAGLSRFGVEAIGEMNRLGIIVDLSHTGHRTTLEAAAVSDAPVVFSHANAKSVHDSARNIDDEQIRAVATTGGLIGVVGFPPFVSESPRPTVDALIRHIDHHVEQAGINHVGIGIDYFEKMAGYASDEEAREWYDSAITDGQWSRDSYPPPPWHYPEEISDPSKLPNLTASLLSSGYSKQDVAKIMGGNFLRVLSEVRQSAAPSRQPAGADEAGGSRGSDANHD